MSIQELVRYFKGFLENTDILLVLIIILTGVGGFVLGKHSPTTYNSKIEINHETRNIRPLETATENLETAVVRSKQYVASKNGTKYHLLWCPGAKQMKEENKVYFDSKEDAEKAGYLPASNCKGI